jgi:hypothetical protein
MTVNSASYGYLAVGQNGHQRWGDHRNDDPPGDHLSSRLETSALTAVRLSTLSNGPNGR